MIYPYECSCCGNKWDVIKRVSEINNPEYCCQCNNIGERKIAQKGHFYGAEVEDAEFCPALGCVVKSKAHRRRLAKQLGLVEVGNENMEKWSQERERQRQNEIKKFYMEDVAIERLGNIKMGNR